VLSLQKEEKLGDIGKRKCEITAVVALLTPYAPTTAIVLWSTIFMGKTLLLDDHPEDFRGKDFPPSWRIKGVSSRWTMLA
jgi:hypothetical protein